MFMLQDDLFDEFALNHHNIFGMPLLCKSSLSGSVSVCREKVQGSSDPGHSGLKV